MKLFDSSSSPFVRKVNVVIHELQLDELIERLPQSAHPVQRDAKLVAHNPLGQVPTLLLDDGEMLCDSRVICEYLDRVGRGTIFPQEPAQRWRALTLQSLADGLLDAAILIRYETMVRPESQQSAAWIDGQRAKIASVLEAIERSAADFGERFDIGTLTCGCALGYLDFRYADWPWRAASPSAAEWFERFSQRPSMLATVPRPRQ
ncbi:MAG: glutathione S-transferase [Burkholderiaceae bacterium]